MTPGKKLESYRKKRDFNKSPEPSSDHRPNGGDQPIFVIQKHDATNLHYDFRLEVEGVLVSWAVPKGPSTDPREKRLAVRTEDHPLSYAHFEGVIPEDQYGGGTVLVWDSGPYQNIMANKDAPLTMAQALDKGHIEVWLEGQKLRGGYALIHTRMNGKQEQWLLIKMRDTAADARRNPVSTEPCSILSGKTLAEIAAKAEEG